MLKEFKQRTLSLSQYINEATRLVHACNYGTETNRLLCDIIVSGIRTDKAYSQCITKGNDLTLQECIEICKNVNAMDRQMKAFRKDKEDTTPTVTEVHKLHHNGAHRHNSYN